MAISVTKPTVGGSENTWGATINTGIDTIVGALNGTSGTVAPDLSTLTINGTDVTATAAELNTASTHYVPTGGIIMWSGAIANIPAGWTLCDGIDHGEQEVPDLRNLFIVGAGSTYGVGAQGGADTVTLTTNNMPAHNHSASSSSTSTVYDPGHDHNAKVNSASPSAASGTTRYAHGTGPAYFPTDAAITGISVSTSTSTTIGIAGSNVAHENRPPYYALAYIMKL